MFTNIVNSSPSGIVGRAHRPAAHCGRVPHGRLVQGHRHRADGHYTCLAAAGFPFSLPLACMAVVLEVLLVFAFRLHRGLFRQAGTRPCPTPVPGLRIPRAEPLGGQPVGVRVLRGPLHLRRGAAVHGRPWPGNAWKLAWEDSPSRVIVVKIRLHFRVLRAPGARHVAGSGPGRFPRHEARAGRAQSERVVQDLGRQISDVKLQMAIATADEQPPVCRGQ